MHGSCGSYLDRSQFGASRRNGSFQCSEKEIDGVRKNVEELLLRGERQAPAGRAAHRAKGKIALDVNQFSQSAEKPESLSRRLLVEKLMTGTHLQTL